MFSSTFQLETSFQGRILESIFFQKIPSRHSTAFYGSKDFWAEDSNLKKYHWWRACKIRKKSLHEQAALWKIIETTGSRFTSSDSSKTKGKFLIFIDHIDNSVWFWFNYLLMMRDPRTIMGLSSDGP